MAAAAFAAPHADTERRAGLRKEGRGRKRNRIIEMTIPDMKTRIFGALALLLWSVGAAAQNNPYVAVEGAVETGGGVVVSLPRTSIGVDIVVERDATVCGPYARYAQKYLGVRAPLTDKTVWSVASASLSLLDAQEALGGGRSPEAGPQRRVVSHTDAEEEFVRLQPDRTSAAAVAPEEAARQAAATIFALRRHRMELITGEAGEHVFGEGLRAALDEIDRLEQRYLELFLGKRTVTVETRRYVVAVYSLPLQPGRRPAARERSFGRHGAVADRTFGRAGRRGGGLGEGYERRAVPRGRSVGLRGDLRRSRICARRAPGV